MINKYIGLYEKKEQSKLKQRFVKISHGLLSFEILQVDLQLFGLLVCGLVFFGHFVMDGLRYNSPIISTILRRVRV